MSRLSKHLKITNADVLHETIKTLEIHNQWRRGAEIPMTSPKLLGEAIDYAVKRLKEIG